MPGWHKAAKQWSKQYDLQLVGIIQEQHKERCRLYAQWQQFDWPILHDPINILKLTGVPILIAIDEHGVVRSTRPRLETFEEQFLKRKFEPSSAKPETLIVQEPIEELSAAVDREPSVENLVALADQLVLWKGNSAVDRAIEMYQKALKLRADLAAARFALGVAYRMRLESDSRQPGDFQAAVDSWSQALSLDRNQYIWRRRIQQYGPRLDKPYPFYDWVSRAQGEITARGAIPIELPIPPYGSEIATPSRRLATVESATNPDPNGQINRDKTKAVSAEVTLVPARLKPGATVRVHLTFIPNRSQKTCWNNESDPLQVWFNATKGLKLSKQHLVYVQPKHPESKEVRTLDLEVGLDQSAKSPARLSGYALYSICSEDDGVCRFVRQDLEIPIAENLGSN